MSKKLLSGNILPKTKGCDTPGILTRHIEPFFGRKMSHIYHTVDIVENFWNTLKKSITSFLQNPGSQLDFTADSSLKYFLKTRLPKCTIQNKNLPKNLFFSKIMLKKTPYNG
ncbi:MAG: hypothetical protein LBF22_13035 [Deltaproteobacteria bacterium]|jgi:hypothetical protein|nr:hypothetical protein [Deltaproteobacteria bacterium]